MSTLTWPLRVAADGSLASTEQASDEDVASCVRCILSYPQGWRFDNPDFGRAQLTFEQNGVDVTDLTREVLQFEPLATAEIVASAIEDGIQRVSVDPGQPSG